MKTNFQASNAQQVLNIVARQLRSAVESNWVYFSECKGRKYYSVHFESRMGGAGITISISNNTAEDLVSNYNFRGSL